MNLKQYSDCKFVCIKCEEQLTVEKEVGEHVDEQAEFRPVSDDRETDIVLNASLFSSQGEEDLKKSEFKNQKTKQNCDRCSKYLSIRKTLKAHEANSHEGITCSFCEHFDPIIKNLEKRRYVTSTLFNFLQAK